MTVGGRVDDPTWPRDLVGFRVDGCDGEAGRISYLSFERDYMIVDTGRWLFGRRVVVPTSLVEYVDDANKRVSVPVSKDDVKDGPQYEPVRGFDPDYADELRLYYATRTRPLDSSRSRQ